MVYTLIVYYSFICLIINYSLLYLSIIAIESAKIHIFFCSMKIISQKVQIKCRYRLIYS